MAKSLTLIGAGRMAQAVARIMTKAGVTVQLYARTEEARAEMTKAVEGLVVHESLGDAVAASTVMFIAVPADELPDAANAYGEFARGDHVVLTPTRGVGDGFTLPHEMIRAKTCVRKIGYVGGPLHARELASGRQLNLVLASRYSEVIDAIRGLTKGTPVAVHRSKDVVGVQVAGAISNVASIASGMAVELDLGDTANGILLAHGLVDATRIGCALGGAPTTFSGLAGIGELLPRHVTSMDRHTDVGRALARGEKLDTALATAKLHVEGIKTANEAVALAEDRGIELSLVKAVHDVMHGKAAAQQALEAVLHRSLDLDRAIAG